MEIEIDIEISPIAELIIEMNLKGCTIATLEINKEKHEVIK